jgi:hypothetical protein
MKGIVHKKNMFTLAVQISSVQVSMAEKIIKKEG